MDDLSAQLRDYIDGVAAPVELTEVVARDRGEGATTGPNGSRPERAYLVEEKDHRPLASARAHVRRRHVIGALATAAAVIAVTVAVAVTRHSTHQPNGSAATPTTAAPPITTATPLTASRVAQMLAAGQSAAIASEIEPPSRRSADQVILEQAWRDLTNGYGTLLSTETQDEDLFPPPAPPDSPGGVVDETVLQMSHGLIMLGVTLSPDGALVHVELLAQALVLAGPSGYIGPPLGF